VSAVSAGLQTPVGFCRHLDSATCLQWLPALLRRTDPATPCFVYHRPCVWGARPCILLPGRSFGAQPRPQLCPAPGATLQRGHGRRRRRADRVRRRGRVGGAGRRDICSCGGRRRRQRCHRSHAGLHTPLTGLTGFWICFRVPTSSVLLAQRSCAAAAVRTLPQPPARGLLASQPSHCGRPRERAAL